MKDIIRFLFLTILFPTLLAVSVVACSDDDDETAFLGLKIDTEEVTLAATGGSAKLLVESAAEWVATISEPWVTLSPANGVGVTECSLLVDSTLLSGLRSADIRFATSNGETTVVTVRQTGFGKVIVVEQPEAEVEASAKLEERYYEAIVTANVPFDVEIDYQGVATDWLSVDTYTLDFDRGARPRTFKLRFDWKMNTVPEERVALVNFVPKNIDDILEEPAVLSLKQKAALRIEDNRQGDSLALLTIFERLNSIAEPWDASENMRNWSNVSLWEASDKDLPAPEAVGRVRSVSYMLFNIDEQFPQEIKYLTYLESLSISSNTNTMLKSLELGDEICSLKHLKELTVFSYGLVSLPDDFVNLGATLEYLDLSANNLSTIPSVLTKENFPKLKSLVMLSNRRWNTSDIRRASEYENGLGLYFNTENDNSLRRLLLWDTLEELRLSNNYIEGSLPDFTVGEEGVVAYTQADVDAFGGDTIQYLADNNCPKILPNMKALALNLNFFTGNLPNWLLYHPNLLMWVPDILIFNQQEQGRNSAGDLVRFDNAPTNFEYYYEAFPGTRDKYEFKEEIAE